MRFLSVLATLGILGLALFAQRYRSSKVAASDPVSDPALDIFYNRALKHPPGAVRDPVIVAALNASPIGNVYKTIAPERSVLMYDCDHASNWCADAAFSFKRMFQIAAKFANLSPSGSETLAKNWYDAANNADGFPPESVFTSLDNAPFQLLAVANRMDMASLSGDIWSGAEVHFAYGLTPPEGVDPQTLTVIVEFLLKPMDRTSFALLAKQWIGLTSDSPDQPALALSKLLREKLTLDPTGTSRIQLINIRTNHDLMGPSWNLTQFRLDLGSSAFVPAPLDDQINATSQQPTSTAFHTIWTNAAPFVGQGYAIPDGFGWLEGSKLLFGESDPPIGTPSGVCNPDVNLRNMLGLQECSGCHTTESRTEFQHLANRKKGATKSQPSNFLIGPDSSGGSMRPDPVDLYYPDSNLFWQVSIDYTTFGGARCTTPVRQTEVRRFHDIARRTLFLAAASLDQPMNHGRFVPNAMSTHSVE